MPLRFFNTHSRQIEQFEPRDPADRTVGIYTCGPTVYSRAHIGNFRAYIFEDLLQRHLELRGYEVHRVMNITDVDDKTIRGAREAGVPLTRFTAQFKEAFFEDVETLRIKRADEFPAATDQGYIDRMIEMIRVLISRGLAYQAEDKSVYFRINKFPDYGKLAHFDLTQLQSTGRVKHDEYDKEHIGDFALWKAWDEEDGDVKWDSPWGPGRPGWHIECSAMSTALLGDEIDIHCGGVDNIFPHHEAEIAQSEGVTGKKFVRYWLHCAHLLVDGQKMSKSLGNFYTVPDVLAKGYTGRELRYALLRVHYRVPLNFTWEGMNEARESLGRIDEWLVRLHEVAEKGNAQRSTPINREQAQRSGFCLSPFERPIARWMKTNWTPAPQKPGWIGGSGPTLFSTSKLNLKSSCHRKRRSLHRNAIPRGGKKIGRKATNCASEFSPSAGKCATQKTARNSPAAQQSDSENLRSQQRTRFAMLSAENVCACRFSRPRTHSPSEVVRKPELCVGRA